MQRNATAARDADAYRPELIADEEPRYLRRQKPVEIRRKKFSGRGWPFYRRGGGFCFFLGGGGGGAGFGGEVFFFFSPPPHPHTAQDQIYRKNTINPREKGRRQDRTPPTP